MFCYILFISLLGPAESLFQESYYELMKKALKSDGLLCCQGKHLIFVCTKHMIEQALPLTKIDVGHCFFFSNRFNLVQENNYNYSQTPVKLPPSDKWIVSN